MRIVSLATFSHRLLLCSIRTKIIIIIIIVIIMSECGASTTLCAIIININIIIMIVVVVVVASHSQRMHQEHHRRSNRQSLLRQTQNLKPKNVCSTSSLLLLNAFTFMLAFAILPYAKRNILYLLLHERCMSTYTMYVDCRLPSRMGYSFVYISE